MLKIFREEEVLVQNGNVIDAKNFYLYVDRKSFDRKSWEESIPID